MLFWASWAASWATGTCQGLILDSPLWIPVLCPPAQLCVDEKGRSQPGSWWNGLSVWGCVPSVLFGSPGLGAGVVFGGVHFQGPLGSDDLLSPWGPPGY